MVHLGVGIDGPRIMALFIRCRITAAEALEITMQSDLRSADRTQWFRGVSGQTRR